jgi:CheY-like chemotaxis protein/chemotaxis signal transduction protein
VSLPPLLLVDDSEAALALERSVLGGHYLLSSASNGREALSMVPRLKPAAILLDLSMPEMDGEEVLARLKADPEVAEIPVLIISSEIERGRACLRRGAAAFLAKPFRREELLATVGRVLSEAQARSRLGSMAVLPIVVGPLHLAINLVYVRLAVSVPTIRPLPEGPSYLMGYAEVHHELVCVVDLAERLAVEHSELLLERKLVLVADERLPLALCVDRVHDPEEVPFGRVTRIARALEAEDAQADVIEAVVATEARSLPVLNPRRLLSRGLRRRLPSLVERALREATLAEGST